VTGVVVAFAFILYASLVPVDVPKSAENFSIAQGASLQDVSRQLAAAGVIHDRWTFLLLARLRGNAGNIKAGTYEIVGQSNQLDVLTKITKGDFARSEILIVEGWTFRQMRGAVNQHPQLRHDSLNYSDKDLVARIDPTIVHPEGLFFPATYYFSPGSSDLVIFRQAYTAMQNRLQTLWSKRKPGLPLAVPYEAVILASVVEKETGRKSDRNMIAAVLVNRLKIGMRLQSDPTVIYGMGDAFDGNLRKKDLLTDQRYNSYTRSGLPPTPIALPGEASLMASLNPASSDVLYFVARGDGSSEFSRTLADHNRAVNRYQK
jgi:UPF0755 protein